MNERERRGTSRVTAETKVDYRTVSGFATDYTQNISQGGLFVETSMPFSPDERIRLRLTLPGHELPFALEGIVRWARTDPDAGPLGMGVEFVTFDGGLKEELERFVNSLQAEPEE